jgi:hypothetical protein
MIDTNIDTIDILGGKPQEWWLYGPAWLRATKQPVLTGLPIVVVTVIFYWATETHQNLAIILGALLADFLIVTRGRKLLRGFVAYILICAIYGALTSLHPHPASFVAARNTGSYHSADSSTLSLPPVWRRNPSLHPQQEPR